jgi:hypothetical protein
VGADVTFYTGQTVWIGYCDKSLMRASVDPRLKTGTILGGPFTDRLCGNDYVPGKSWRVAPDTGGAVIVSEALLSPFEDPGEAETRETEREVTA